MHVIGARRYKLQNGFTHSGMLWQDLIHWNSLQNCSVAEQGVKHSQVKQK